MMSKFSQLPLAGKVGGGVLVAGSLVGVAYILAPQFAYLVLIGIIAAGLIVGLYLVILKQIQKRKSDPFEKKLAENSSAAPAGVTDAARRANLDALRNKFREGIQQFKDHGKDIYSLPWYLLVGEPGSGKTEAIRRCGVQRPPGLQDELQGAGGTLNMHWWFTNHAVILDTAGKLLFEEAPPGKTSEWKEFLKLMRAARPNCPINGLMLVIPVDSLIRDNADEITRKGGRIAEQLDGIQRALGVRFPAFVVITKCDLISGFREFFSELNDPDLQHQILGWSIPADLDAPFNPELVDEHVSHVASRLRKRRMALLLDPVHTEDADSGRRLDEVDGLYSFPDAMETISARLKMYMETVFVAGEWSSKPLFLRGIYFTSSMQEGAALDAELAEAMGISVDALPEHQGFRQNKSLFLRDLFMSKVFKERGLVTNANNARRQQRRRRTAILGFAVASVLVLIGVTVVSGNSYENAIGAPTKFWGGLAEAIEKDPDELRMISDAPGGNYAYRGAGDVEIGGERVRRDELPVRTRDRAQTGGGTPVVYKPIAGLTGGDVFQRQSEAHRSVVESFVITPFLDAARERLATDQGWRPGSAEAAAELIRVRAGVTDGSTPVELEPLARYVFDGSVSEASPADVAKLQEVIVWTYSQSEQGGRLDWDADRLKLEPPPGDPLASAAGRLFRHWRGELDAAASQEDEGERSGFARAVVLRDALLRLDSAESRLRALPFGDVNTVDDYRTRRSEFLSAFGEVEDAKRAVDEAASAFDDASPRGLQNAVISSADELRAQADADYRTLLDELDRAAGVSGRDPGADDDDGSDRAGDADSPDDSADEPTNDLGDRLPEDLRSLRNRLLSEQRSLREAINDDRNDLNEQLARLARGTLDRTPADARRLDVRYDMYLRARQALDNDDAEIDSSGGLAAVLATVRTETDSSVSQLAQARGPESQAQQATKDAFASARAAVRAAGRYRLHREIAQLLAPFREGELDAIIAQRVERPVARPIVPFTQLAGDGVFDPRFDPASAAQVARGIAQVAQVTDGPASGDQLRPLDAGQLSLSAARAQQRLERYLETLAGYWGERLQRSLEITQIERDWSRLAGQLDTLQVDAVNRALLEVARLAVTAGEAAGEFARPADREAFNRFRDMVSALDGSDSRYESAVFRVIGNWKALPPSAREARERVLGLTPAAFEERYLRGVYAEASSPPVAYWSELIGGSLRVFAVSAESEVRSSVRTVLESARGFPIAINDTSRPVPPGRLEDIYRNARGLLAASGSGPASGVGGDTIAGGAVIQGAPTVSEQLRRLRGRAAINENVRRWLASRMLPVLEFLHGDDGGRADPPTAELVVLPASMNPGGANAFPEFAVAADGRTTRLDVRNPPASSGVVIEASSDQPVELRFFRVTQTSAPNEPPFSRVTIQPPWQLIELIRRPGAREMTGGPLAGVWQVPITTNGPGGQVTFVLGLRFDRPVPDLDDWPRTQDWPAPGGG